MQEFLFNIAIMVMKQILFTLHLSDMQDLMVIFSAKKQSSTNRGQIHLLSMDDYFDYPIAFAKYNCITVGIGLPRLRGTRQLDKV